MSDGIFSIAEEKWNRIKSGQTDNGKDNSADDLEIWTENTGNKVLLEKTDQAPVDSADDDEREN